MIVQFQVHEYSPSGSIFAYRIDFEELHIPVRKGKEETGQLIVLRRCVDVIGNRKVLCLLGHSSKAVKSWMDINYAHGYKVFKIEQDETIKRKLFRPTKSKFATIFNRSVEPIAGKIYGSNSRRC